MILDEFVKNDNIIEQIKKGFDFLQIDNNSLDFLSIDMDGNDYHFLNEIITHGIKPTLICIEYNAKFPLPIEIVMEYDANYLWKDDDYFGASLQSYINLLQDNYTLLCCNLNGVNAFFIRNDFKYLFDIIDPMELYIKPLYLFSSYYKGHKPSSKFISQMIKY
jgi:hypothetical protein